MTSLSISDPTRFRLANELHSRPFPQLRAPCRAVFLAIRPPGGDARDRTRDRADLIALIDRFGGQHPTPDAASYSGDLGRATLKWESHTEFTSYTIFTRDAEGDAFCADPLAAFPKDWLESVDGAVLSAAQVNVVPAAGSAEATAHFKRSFEDQFVSESLAIAFTMGGEALVASDFRLHEDGFARIAVMAIEGIGPRRLGRVVQRLLEIECYKSIALETLPIARAVAKRVTELDGRLSRLTVADASAAGADAARAMLDELTALSGEVERLSTETAFRFGAAEAYEAIVNDRIDALREERIAGRQVYSEFMKRRFDPAMRTCKSAERRLNELSDHLARASALLSTRVNVAVKAQNQRLLQSMDRRADLQLRLQQTVEGLSIVAISYYALGLASTLIAPIASRWGVDKTETAAALVIPVVGAVWLGLRRLKRKWED